jgi:hypothetical protein
MKLLDRHIERAMARGTSIALLVIIGPNVVFSLIRETDELGKGT